MNGPTCTRCRGVVCYADERSTTLEAAVHGVKRRDEIAAAPVQADRSEGLTRAPLVDAALHMTLDLCSLDLGGGVDEHLHSFEESFLVFAGRPLLRLEERTIRLEPGGGGIV